MNRLYWSFALFLLCFAAHAQELAYVQEIVKELAADDYYGRGYVNNGQLKAAQRIKKEMLNLGLKPYIQEKEFFQPFRFAVHSYPSPISLKLDNQELRPGYDFIVDPGSEGEGSYNLVCLTGSDLKTTKSLARRLRKLKKDDCLVIKLSEISRHENKNLLSLIQKNVSAKNPVIYLEPEKLTWGVRSRENKGIRIYMLAEKYVPKSKRLSLSLPCTRLGDFEANNIIGYIPGTEETDSLILFTAHYDHLGMFGPSATFNGANDNASGTGAMLDMARYYLKPENKPRYTTLFIAFAAEEAGLLGSKHLVESGLIDLNKISLLINLDLMANGEKGAMMVNGRGKDSYKQLKGLNEKNSLMPAVKARPNAANSDHYWFAQKGVRHAYFFYLMGEYPYYHDVYDRPEVPQFQNYEAFIRLIIDWVNLRAKAN